MRVPLRSRVPLYRWSPAGVFEFRFEVVFEVALANAKSKTPAGGRRYKPKLREHPGEWHDGAKFARRARHAVPLLKTCCWPTTMAMPSSGTGTPACAQLLSHNPSELGLCTKSHPRSQEDRPAPPKAPQRRSRFRVSHTQRTWLRWHRQDCLCYSRRRRNSLNFKMRAKQ